VALFNRTATRASSAAPESAWLFTEPECQQEFARIAEKLRPRAAAIVLAGVSGREGVTIVTLNLAHAFATGENSRTLVVDANFRNPALHRLVDVPLDGGVSDWDGNTEPDYRQAAGSANLYFLTAGSKYDNIPVPAARSLLTSLSDRARSSFGLVLFDAPAIGAYPDSLALARICDGVVLVAESDETRISALSYAREQIADVGGSVAGVILNRSGRYLPKWMR
jgi:Mrp family chromosome partitioning ATPase